MSDEGTSRGVSRRAYLAGVGAGLAGAAGCVRMPTADADGAPGEPAPGGSWPQVGKSAGHGGHNPLEAGADRPRPEWSRTVSGPVTTPTVVDDAVYVARGAPSDGGPRATLEAYDLASGERRWSRPLSADGEPVTFAFAAPYSNLRPVYRRGRLHVALGDRIAAIDAGTRERAWTTERYEPLAFTTPPTVGPGGVYAGGLESLVAFDHDGTERWAFPEVPESDRGMVDATERPGSVRLAAVAGDATYVSAGTHVARIGPDGTVAWRETPEEPRAGTIVHAEGTLVRAGFRGVEARELDGTRRWLASWPGKATIRPAVADGTAFVAGLEGTVAAYDLEDGERRWTRTLPFTEWSQGTVPAVTEAAVHLLRVSSDERRVRVHTLDRDDGETRWHLEADATRARGPIPARGRYVFTAEVTPEERREDATVSSGQDTTTTLWAYAFGE